MAVLPFENLTTDSKLNWLSVGANAALVSDLTGMRTVYAFPVDGAHASRAVEAYFDATGDRLHMHATVEDLAKRRVMQQFEVEGPRLDGPLPLIDRLARQIDPAARAFSTHDRAAFESFGEALSSQDAGVRARLLQTATVQDPNFTAAYSELADTLLALNQPAQAQNIASAGLAHARDALDRARLTYVLAVSQSNLAARKQALADLERLLPADPEPWRDLAGIEIVERNFAAAVRDYRQATHIDPADPQTYNQLGYAEAYAGDLAAARGSILEYRRLAPEGDFNPLDSLGEVSFYLGDFAAAERYFLEANRRNPVAGEMLKAAQARLLTGDLSGADGLFKRRLNQHKEESAILAAYRQAQWEFLTGRRKQALSRLQALAPGSSGDASALVNAQLAIWSVQTGNRPEAGRYAEAAVGSAVSPGARNLAALCRFLVATPWKPSNNAQADAYALVLAGRFADAIAPLETVYRATPPSSDGEVRTLLAWAYQQTGQSGKARDLTRLYPIPLAQSESLFASLAFPRFLQVKGNQKLFDLYKGDLPDNIK